MIEITEPKFTIKDEVYHTTPGSSKGIVLDIAYYFSVKQYKYYVTFGINNDAWCVEEELSYKQRR